jgi:dCMP deaminase
MMENRNFIQTARGVARLSDDPERKVGCVITHPIEGILTVGFNRIPKRLEYPGCYNDQQYKRDHVIHAEEDAIVAARTSLNGCSLYSTRFTCHECAKLVIAAGIDSVFAPRWEEQSSWAESFAKALEAYRRAKVEVVFMVEVANGLYEYEDRQPTEGTSYEADPAVADSGVLVSGVVLRD